MKFIFTKFLFIGVLFSMLVQVSLAQSSDQLATVRAAIASGSSHDLAQYLAPSVEVGLDGDRQTYSATQTELVMKNFFTKNPPTGFDIEHQGASNEGIPYAIGHYTSRNGNYRVFIKLKSSRGVPVIDALEFTKE